MKRFPAQPRTGEQPPPRRRSDPLASRLLAAALVLGLLAALFVVAWPQRGPAKEKPRHRGLPVGIDCAACHTTKGWTKLKPKPTIRFHHERTGFPLRAAHAALACDRCHDGRGIAREAAGCVVCHTDVHKGENGLRCERCHNERSFAVSDAVRRHRQTRLPLTGAHALLECTACHHPRQTGRFRAVPAECYACHAKDYARTDNPPHQSAGFSTRCEQCHIPRAWPTSGTSFHSFFPLRGRHASLDCNSCHAGNRFKGTPRDCFSCHEAQYVAAQNPPHQASGFSTRCEQCHTESAWVPASRFDHSTWPLTGAHRALACDRCHTGGVFAGTPRDCFSCHQNDYNQTTNPNHLSSGFGTQCDQCHTTTAWRPANFNHDRFFPISSGKHARFRNDCSNCHPNANDKSVFSCITCHEHNRTKMDNKHRGRSGYVYDSNACYRCHPDGRE